MSIVVLPRIRGGDPENSPDFATMGGSVPRIFGVDSFFGTRLRVTGVVFLAYAGVIPCLLDRRHHRVSAPRICGDDPGTVEQAIKYCSCSPHMRG